VICDALGNATVELPDYFDEININFSYILTAVGGAAPELHVSKEISGNQFNISGGKAGLKVSWQVSAQRNDIYMQANPFNAEQMKPERKRGTYMYPKGYGLDESKLILNTTMLNKMVTMGKSDTERTSLKLMK
jgi:hypothetical protein